MANKKTGGTFHFDPKTDAERILANLIDTGMISLSDVQDAEIMKKKPQVLSVHPYSITHNKTLTYGWSTYVEDEGHKNNRRKVMKKTEA